MSKDSKGLSSNVLDMKFMRRTKQRMEEKDRKKKEAELQKAYLAGEAADPGKSTEDSGDKREKYIFTRDLEFLEDLQFGRLSFKGHNPAVERLMVYYTNKKNGVVEEDSDEEKDISDSEMAETMRGASLENTIANKFKRKAQKESLIDESNIGSNKKRQKRYI